jgi:hypothetical protein
LGVV